MKRMVIMLSIVGTILACGAVTQVWLHQYTEDMSVQLELLSEAVGKGDPVRHEIGAILSEWDQCQKHMGIWASENVLDQVESHLKNAEMLSHYPDDETYRHQLRLELLNAADAAEELWQKEKISIQNIL